ncbi:MAG TPA: hypothetical protein VES02_15620, partial [Dermatophilaceae bacterium]|nr:hypothetical protein [Dermatophilaceae bacterium]
GRLGPVLPLGPPQDQGRCVIMRRVRQATWILVMAALAVLGSAAAASAAFRTTATGTLSATTFKLLPPTIVKATCKSRIPVVTFTPSPSIGDVPDHAGTTPPQVFRYAASLTVKEKVTTTYLGPLVTTWRGPKQDADTSPVFSIVTTYGSWKSAAAVVSLHC